MVNIINQNQTIQNEFVIGDTLFHYNTLNLNVQTRFFPKSILENMGLVLYVYSGDSKEILNWKRYKELSQRPYVIGI
jgi:hypothetical protein